MKRPCIVMLCALLAFDAQASAISVANAIRRQGCGAHSGVATPLAADAATSAIAERWSKGGRLGKSVPSGYGSAEFASLHVEGARNDALLAQALRAQFCEPLTRAQFRRFGVHRDADEYWLVLSSKADSPTARDAARLRTEALQLVNRARSQPRRCGSRNFKAAGPLKANSKLDRAAQRHAANMARHGKLQHEGFDGSTPAGRATFAGYAWRTVGENIAAGPTTAAGVVAMWLESPGHCANIMSPQFTEIGLAFAEEADRDSGVYWAQVFGAPR